MRRAAPVYNQVRRCVGERALGREGLEACTEDRRVTGEERSIASLFSPGGTHALAGEFAGTHDFEVVAYVVILAAGSQ